MLQTSEPAPAGATAPTTVALIGAEGALGRRVASIFEARTGWRVLADVERDGQGDAASADESDDAGANARADVLVDLGSSDHDRRAERRESVTEWCASTLALADRLGVTHLAFVSSALVYGASANNPLPITEDAVLRPEVDFVFARQLASAEELVEQWRQGRAGRSTAVLRPALALAEGDSSRLARALVAGLGRRFAEADPPAQFLHLDDLADAVAVAVVERLDGVFNVAPDRWIAGERVRALSGERPRLPLPARLGDVVSRISWRFQRGPIPPGLAPYTRESWVVANGRLRAHGWRPTVTNEQTYVEATEAPWWTMLTPKRRQELTLGAAVVCSLLGLVGLGVAARAISRRRALRRR